MLIWDRVFSNPIIIIYDECFIVYEDLTLLRRTFMKQNDAVFSAVCSVLGEESFNGAVKLSKDQTSEVVESVTNGIYNGEVDFSDSAKEKYSDRASIRKYVIGMVNNHLRKDKRLNGGTKYEAKNPGSRAGSGDPVLKSLKALLALCETSAQKDEVTKEIDARLATLNKAKAKVVEINWDLIPEHLRSLAG